MERVRIGKDIVFQWEVRKDGAALTAEDAANLTLEIAGRNGKSQRLPFEIRDSKIVAAWYGVRQTEIGAYRLTCWHNRGKVGESVVDVVWAVELVRYTTEETFDDIETVTIELEGGNLTFAALKGASAYEVAVAEGFVGTEAEWIASLKKPAEDAAEDAEEAAARAIEAAENAGAAATIAETAAQTAENAAGDANTAAGLANTAAANAEAKAQLADAAADNANTAANEAYNKAQEADTAATTATNAAQSANSAAASADEAARGAVEAAVEATESAENAQTQADYANEMAIAAEKVNAQLNGNVLTVTNRQGTSTSVNTKGEQGEQGNPGQAATISVGTTTTGAPGTNAQVTNSGTSSAAVLNFVIPRGEPGEVTEAELTQKLAAKANTDGYYSRMIVGGAESLIGDVPQTATYTFRRTGGGAIGEPVARLTEIQGNTGVVNQLVLDTFANTTNNGVTFTADTTNHCISCSGTGNHSYAGVGTPISTDFIVGHKYYYRHIVVANPNSLVFMFGLLNQIPKSSDADYSYIWTAGGTGRNIGFASGVNGVDITGIKVRCAVIDLTIEYGAGYEPGTVAEFEARIWRDYGKTLDEYVAYTQGKLVNCKALALESVGQNQWDEEWELGLFNADGTITTGNRIVSKNYIPLIPNATYSMRYAGGILGTRGRAAFYDENFNIVRYFGDFPVSVSVVNNATVGAFTVPQGAMYLKFCTSGTYINNYLNDICINISDAAINGTYRPYWKEVTNLNLTTLTGINPNTGVRETIFPNGIGGGEGWRDVVKVVNGATVAVVNTGRVNLGSLDWYKYIAGEEHVFAADYDPIALAPSSSQPGNLLCAKYTTDTANRVAGAVLDKIIGVSGTYHRIFVTHSAYNDAASFKAAMDGIYLEYQLAEPIVYTDIQYVDGTPFVLPTNFEVQSGGTERITHTDGEESIAPVMSAIYGLNAVGFVQDAPKDYTSQATLDSLTSLLSSLTGHSITKTWDAANNKWVFS